MPDPLAPLVRLQSGALVYRWDANGQVRVLVVRKRKSNTWGIPKGRIEIGLDFSENAAKEAFEEAGVLGEIEPCSVGMFRTTKKFLGRSAVIEIWVYLMRATSTADDWPERTCRETKWVSCREAATLLAEPLLVDLCKRLGSRRLGAPRDGSTAASPSRGTRPATAGVVSTARS